MTLKLSSHATIDQSVKVNLLWLKVMLTVEFGCSWGWSCRVTQATMAQLETDHFLWLKVTVTAEFGANDYWRWNCLFAIKLAILPRHTEADALRAALMELLLSRSLAIRTLWTPWRVAQSGGGPPDCVLAHLQDGRSILHIWSMKCAVHKAQCTTKIVLGRSQIHQITGKKKNRIHCSWIFISHKTHGGLWHKRS